MNRTFSSLFRGSALLGAAQKLTVFFCSLVCGYLLSQILSGEGPALRLGGWTALAMGIGLLPIFFLTKTRSRMSRREEENFRESLYSDVMEARLEWENPGALDVKLTEDAGAVLRFYQNALPEAVGSLAVMAGAGALLLREDWRLGLLFLALDLMQLLPTLLYEKWAKRIYEATRATEESYDSWILEGYCGIRTLKSCCKEEWFLRELDRRSRSIIEAGCRAEKTGTLENVVYAAIDNLLRYGSLVILGVFVLYFGLDAGKTPVLIVLGSYLFTPMDGIFDFRLSLFSARSAMERLAISDIPARTPGKTLAARGLRKAYGEKQVLNGLSFTMEDDEKILLVGGNGSGKTTLLRLLLGLETPTAGETADCPAAYALQEEPKLHILVSELEEAMKLPGAVPYLQALGVDGLRECYLDELSQGQVTKLCLAWALGKDEKLLVLDEPTNHLDRESVDCLTEILRRRPGPMLICSHDKRLEVNWGRVLTMDGGMLRES